MELKLNLTLSDYFRHPMPTCKSLNTLLFDDIFTLTCLKFYHRFQNNLLPSFFYDEPFINTYEPRRQNLRTTIPMLYPNYVITTPSNFRPNFAMPTAKKGIIAEKISISHCLLIEFCKHPCMCS